MTQTGYPFEFIGTNTVGADIALDVYRRDPLSSFFFIGAADSRDKSSVSTRRYRVYMAFVNDLNLSRLFRIIELKDQSMSVLVNCEAVAHSPYTERIISAANA